MTESSIVSSKGTPLFRLLNTTAPLAIAAGAVVIALLIATVIVC